MSSSIDAAKALTEKGLAFLDGGPWPFTGTRRSEPGDPEPTYVALTADTWIDTGWWHSGVRGPAS